MKIFKIVEYINKIFPNVEIGFVGGYLRDILLEKTPKDYDLTTNLTPNKIQEFIENANLKAYTIGKKFGTIGVKLPINNKRKHELVEITTYRTEVYENSRKPKIKFTSNLEEDLSRRDFTINSFYMSIPDILKIKARFDDIVKTSNIIIQTFNLKKRQLLYDLFNHHFNCDYNYFDITFGVIRSMGNPNKRLKEDPLRILRAIRLSAQLNFTIYSDLNKTIKEKGYRLLRISSERIVDEINKILLLNPTSCYKGLNRLFKLEVFKWIIPELQLQYKYDQKSKYHNLLLHEHTITAVCEARKDGITDLNILWALLLHDIGKPFTAVTKTRKDIILNIYSQEYDIPIPEIIRYFHHEKLGANIVKGVLEILNFPKKDSAKLCRKKVVKLVLNHLDKTSSLKKYDDLAKKNS